MASKASVSTMYYIKTQWGTYAKADNSGWLTYSSTKEGADVFRDFLNDGNEKEMYIRCMSGAYEDWYLSADWNKGMGMYQHWNDAAYWEWVPQGDSPQKLLCKSFKSAGNYMAFRDSNGYFYAYNDYQVVMATKEPYAAGQKKAIPRTLQLFEHVRKGADSTMPYYLLSQFGFVTVDYKGYLTNIGRITDATIFRDSINDQAGTHQMVACNWLKDGGGVIVSTYEQGIMMTRLTKEAKESWKWVKESDGMVLVAQDIAKGSKMAHRKETGSFYANNSFDIAILTKVYYDPIKHEPRFLPK